MESFKNKKLNTFYFLRYISEFTKELKLLYTNESELIHNFRKRLGIFKDELKNIKTVEDLEKTELYDYIEKFIKNLDSDIVIYLKGNDLSILETKENVNLIYNLELDFHKLWQYDVTDENNKKKYSKIYEFINFLWF